MTSEEIFDALAAAGVSTIVGVDRYILPGGVIYDADFFLYGADHAGPIPHLVESGTIENAGDLDRVIAHAHATEAGNGG